MQTYVPTTSTKANPELLCPTESEAGCRPFHFRDEDLSPGTPAFHPSDKDLSPGTPALWSRQLPLVKYIKAQNG
jgi:hypothetical protein